MFCTSLWTNWLNYLQIISGQTGCNLQQQQQHYHSSAEDSQADSLCQTLFFLADSLSPSHRWGKKGFTWRSVRVSTCFAANQVISWGFLLQSCMISITTWIFSDQLLTLYTEGYFVINELSCCHIWRTKSDIIRNKSIYMDRQINKYT